MAVKKKVPGQFAAYDSQSNFIGTRLSFSDTSLNDPSLTRGEKA